MYTAIIAAMPEEIELILQDLVVSQQVNLAQRTLYIGTLYQEPVIIAISHMGKVAAALTATLILSHYKISRFFYVGTAGAAHPELEIGDIVVSDCLVQHDMDASPIFPKHMIPVLGQSVFTPPSAWVRHIQQSGEHYLKHELPQQISENNLQKFHIKQPKLVTGMIASGDQFITDPVVLQLIVNSVSQLGTSPLRCIEMESAAAAQVCHEFSVPFLSIRTISDKADHSAPVDFMRFISEIGSYYLHGVIRQAFNVKYEPGAIS